MKNPILPTNVVPAPPKIFNGSKTARPTVAIIDDDSELRELLVEFYRDRFEVRDYASAMSALDDPKVPTSDLILCDLMMPEIDGLSFLEKIKELGVLSPVILMTAHSTKKTALEAMTRGAFDYIEKPMDLSELKVVTDRALRFSKLEKENLELQKNLRQQGSLGELVGKSKKMGDLFELVKRAAESPANVLIVGESGSGKEIVAKTLHNLGPRKTKPFVAINCSAIPGELLESELFGHKKGAFTGAIEDRIGLFEEANGGTLFLDEIGDMPVELQAKVLRAIQEKKVRPVGRNSDIEVDVRIVAATHQDLRNLIEEKEFREDLYFRLCVIPIKVPPLRDRKEDIPLLANLFLEKYRSHNPRVTGFAPEALEKMIRLKWTGNVRELENTIERALALCNGTQVESTDISTEIDSESDDFISSLFTKLPTLKQLEKEYIQYVLHTKSGKKEEASEILGINRKTLYRKEKEYDLS